MIKVIGDRGILEMIAIFVTVLFVGVVIAVAAINTSSVSIIYDTFSNPMFATFSYFLDITLVLMVLLLVLRRHKHFGNTFLSEGLECMVSSFTSFFVFLLLFAIMIPHSIVDSSIYVYSAALAIMLLLLKEEHHKLRDFTTLVSSIGVGLVLGFNLAFGYAIFILAIVAIYDYIGVFKTKEMIKLARAVSSEDLSFLISVSDLESVPRWGLSDKEIAAYMKYLERTNELDNPKFRKILLKGKLPVVSQISLGEGDLSLPLMVVISAGSSFGNLLAAVVLLGSVMGILATMLILKKYRHPIPAVPPLFAFIGIFVGIAFVFERTNTLYNFGALLLAASAVIMLIDIVTIVRRMQGSRNS